MKYLPMPGLKPGNWRNQADALPNTPSDKFNRVHQDNRLVIRWNDFQGVGIRPGQGNQARAPAEMFELSTAGPQNICTAWFRVSCRDRLMPPDGRFLVEVGFPHLLVGDHRVCSGNARHNS